jgi:translation initiation factor 1
MIVNPELASPSYSWVRSLEGERIKMSKDTRLVYSTDPALNQKCAGCKELLSECTCEPILGVEAAKKSKFVAILRIEKANRGGKTVTVIDQLPKSELYLKDLTTQLKKKCGSGGTYIMSGREGVIEIQGDKRELIRAALAKEGIQFKG